MRKNYSGRFYSTMMLMMSRFSISSSTTSSMRRKCQYRLTNRRKTTTTTTTMKNEATMWYIRNLPSRSSRMVFHEKRRCMCTIDNDDNIERRKILPSNEPFRMTTKPGDLAKDFSPLRLLLEPVRDVTNRALEMADAPVRLNFISSSSSNTNSSSSPSFSPRRKYNADSVVSTTEVDRYVRAVLENPKDRVNNTLVPHIAERQIYALVVRIVLHLLHSALGVFDGKRLMGRVISLSQRRST